MTGQRQRERRSVRERHSVQERRAVHLIDRWRELVGWAEGIDPSWAPQLIVAAAIALDLALPDRLAIGPFWLLPTVEGALLLGLSTCRLQTSTAFSPTDALPLTATAKLLMAGRATVALLILLLIVARAVNILA